VIGFALRHFNARRDTNFALAPDSFPTDNLVFVGMVALLDPPRAESRKAIRQCKEAGVKVYMITGDHPTTAYAVATKIGLIDSVEEERESALTTNGGISAGTDHESESGKSSGHGTIRKRRKPNWCLAVGESLHCMSKEEWDSLLSHHYIVFARTTLEQKLRIVEVCLALN
jgi:sodium/potassium-transporting ATPase subunit alpha